MDSEITAQAEEKSASRRDSSIPTPDYGDDAKDSGASGHDSGSPTATPDYVDDAEDSEPDEDSSDVSNKDLQNLKNEHSVTASSVDTDTELHLGTALSALLTNDMCDAEVEPRLSASHTVLYDIHHFKPGHVPRPFPAVIMTSLCYEHCVQLPCCSSNKTWSLIVDSLSKDITSVSDIATAICTYHHPYMFDFSGLYRYFASKGSEQQSLLSLVHLMAQFALQLPATVTKPIPILRRNVQASISMSQKQAACLLANAFFCTFPPRVSRHQVYLNFFGLFRMAPRSRRESQCAKLDCIFNYFRRVFEDMPCGTITFHRKVLPKKEQPQWEKSSRKLCDLAVLSGGKMEEDAKKMLCVDFANKHIGGGVVDRGCVQEEIMFLLCPELIISRLLAENLDDNESLLVKGFERFNNGIGYARKFFWGGNYVDDVARDKWGRRYSAVTVIDALVLRNASVFDQLSKSNLERELNKAYCGFRSNGRSSTVATGNWGCGAFGGDPRVKAIIQLMAAAQAGRPILYFTFHDRVLAADIYEIHNAMIQKETTVGQLWTGLRNAAKKYGEHLTSEQLYDIILKRQSKSDGNRRLKDTCLIH